MNLGRYLNPTANHGTGGVDSTVVELVPSVPKLVGFFHPNARELMRSPLSHVVIDDGRFYLERSSQSFDIIAIDPPPPVEAAASSLLYSKEFYSIMKPHLRPGGILEQWFPGDEDFVVASVARALQESLSLRSIVSFDDRGKGNTFLGQHDSDR
jgi:spermidine synthase